MSNHFVKYEYPQTFGITNEAKTLNINFSNAMDIFIGNSVLISNRIERKEYRKFLSLTKKWKSETLFISSGSAIISNSAYNDIIDLGTIAIPWIIRDLRRYNGHWFYALEKLTGQNPIKKENVGKMEEMRNDWILWASNNNFL